jgi:DNA-binding IscR family transcriptional regulator
MRYGTRAMLELALHHRGGTVSPSEITAAQQVWAEMYSASMRVLESTTLADLVARSNQRFAAAASYSIWCKSRVGSVAALLQDMGARYYGSPLLALDV